VESVYRVFDGFGIISVKVSRGSENVGIRFKEVLNQFERALASLCPLYSMFRLQIRRQSKVIKHTKISSFPRMIGRKSCAVGTFSRRNYIVDDIGSRSHGQFMSRNTVGEFCSVGAAAIREKLLRQMDRGSNASLTCLQGKNLTAHLKFLKGRIVCLRSPHQKIMLICQKPTVIIHGQVM